MSDDKQMPSQTESAMENTETSVTKLTSVTEQTERSEKILKAKELYSHGSRNFLVKSYAEAADELSEVCGLYEEIYGELSDELGMPYLLYAKSLIALALDENKVIDVPDEEEDDDDDDEDDNEEVDDNDVKEESSNNAKKNGTETSSTDAAPSSSKKTNGQAVDLSPKKDVTKSDEADSTAEIGTSKEVASEKNEKSMKEEEQVSSSIDEKKASDRSSADDDEKPSTSNGDAAGEEDENASSLQLAWEILELASRIFSRQGLNGLPNLAEVKTELANIEFENNILDAAREDYGNALKIYADLPKEKYRRAMAEINYKIGLTYLMQQQNSEGAESLKIACSLIEDEIEEIREKTAISDKDTNNIQDLEETKQEIWAKITEIEETQAQNIAEVRAALDSYIKPVSSQAVKDEDAKKPISSSSTSAAATSSKPTDISHLIKRKRPDDSKPEAETSPSPAKRPSQA